MKIISWDIGIKHLAYCLMEKIDNDFNIIDWGIIDISNTDNNCFYCKSKSKYIYNDKFLCLRHKKKLDIPTIDDIYPKKKTKEKCSKCDKYCIRGGMCQKHAKEEYKKKYSIKKIQSCLKTSLQTLCVSLFENLNDKIKLENIDYVLIENQPTLTNPTMKSISMMVFSYFIMKGIMPKLVKDIKLISPSGKLRLDKEKLKKLENCKTKSEKYHVTKQLGKEICFELIQNKLNAIEMINLYKKQDDMCDAFLQGYKFLFT